MTGISSFCQNIKLNAQGDSINFPGFDESYSACLQCKTNNPNGGELGYSGDASPHKSHQIPLDKTGSGSIMDPPARGATA